MASVRPETNNVHTLGTSTYKWATVHSVDVQAATITTSGDVEIGGNLTVSGTQTILDVTTVSVEDPLLQLAKENTADSVDIGFYGKIVDGSTTEYVGLYRDASDGKFKFFDSATAAPTTTVSGGSTATVVANLEGAVTGNADTATSAAALTTARTITLGGDLGGSVSFDGSSDVTITSTIQSGSVENSMLDNSTITFTDGTNSEALALGATLEIGGTANEVEVAYSSASNKFTVGLPDDVNIAGDLAVSGIISGTVQANSSTATKLATARTISLGGDLGGSASFDGSADVTITATIQSGSVDNAMLANDGISLKLAGVSQEDINLGDDLNFAGTSNEVEIAYDSSSNTLTFGLPSSITAALVGNASTASAWATARTLTLGGDLGGSVSVDGSSDVTLTATIQSGSVENSMLDNSSITISDGVNSSAIALGGTHSIVGTSSEVSVSHSSGITSIGLPSSISGLTSVSATGFTGDLTGNADTATALETARTLSISGDASGSVSFDGSANADIAMTIAAGAVENSMLANDGISLKLAGVSQEDINLGDDLNFAGTSNEVDVAYASASNTLTFSLPSTINAATSGNAATASAWQSARTITLGGDLGGSVSIDGSADATLTATIQAGSVDNAMLANDGFGLKLDGSAQEDINLGDSLDFVSGQDIDLSYNASTNALTVALESEIDSDTTGNAATASAWASARTLSLSGDLGGSVSIDGSANATLNATIQSSSVENSMLANSGITIQDDNAQAGSIALGGSLRFSEVANETTVDFDSSNGIVTIGLPSTITAAVSGNASTASALQTARTLSLTGDVTGSGSFDGSGDLAISTTLAGGTALTFADGGGTSESLDLGSTVTFAGTSNEVDVSYATASNTFTIGLPSSINADTTGNAATASALETARTIALSGDVTGSGSFDGSGNLTISSTLAGGTALTFTDGTNSEALSLGSTLEIGGTSNEVEVAYSTASNKFTVGLPDDVTIAGDLNVSGTITGTVNANSSTATKWATARTITLAGDLGGSVSIDGSADVTLTSTIQAGSVENSMLANDGISITVDGATAEDINLGDSLDFNGTANQVAIAYSAAANDLTFSLPSTINVDTSGNAATATALATSRTLSVSGDATGSASFDGTGNADIALTIASGAVDNAMLANDGFSLQVDSVSQEDINLGDSLNFISGQDIDIAYNTTTNQLSIALESEIDSDTTGNAATASAWASARTLSLGGDLGGSVSIDGSANATLTATIQSGSVENSMLANSGVTLAADSGSNDPVALGETITISGTSNEIETAAAGSNQITIGLPNNVNISNNLTVSNDMTVSSGDLELTDGTLSILGGGASINGTVTINGTHTINGSLIANSATMKFQDSLLEIGYSNTSVVDHGFFSKHSDGEYVGNVFDQSASEFIFFKTDTKPTTTVDTGAAGYAYADARLKNLAANGSIQASGSIINNSSKEGFKKLGYASVSGADTTLSGSQLVGGVILRDVGSTSRSDATATAAQIVAAMPADARVADMSFEAKIILSNSSAQYELTAGSGVTLVGTFASLSDGAINVLVRVTNASSSSEAVTIYKL